MAKTAMLVLVLCVAGAAQAQDSGISASAALKTWAAEWSTFTYRNSQAVPTDPESQILLIPSVSMRWADFLASASGFYKDYGSSKVRREWDLNVGWQVMPGLALWVGYKTVGQLDGSTRYESKGPIASTSFAVPLVGAWSVYGSLGLGRVKTPSSGGDNIVKFSPSPYRITEVGASWSLPMNRGVRALNFSAGYRTQVIVSKGINSDGSGRFNDVTQGLALTASAVF